MKARDWLELAVGILIMLPVTIAMFLLIFGGMISTLFGFGPPVD